MTPVAAAGWLGAAALLVAYLLLTRQVVAPRSRTYITLNLVGSAGLALSSAAATAWPSASLNAIWLAIGVAALIRPPRPGPAEP